MEKTAVRNNGFDFLKAVCAFLIVCIHIPFPGVFGEYFVSLTRIAVPIFFMITGYFYSDTVSRGREGAQLKKIALLTLWANLFYFVFNAAIAVVKGGIDGYIANCFALKSIVKLVVFNESPFHLHLWYLNALLYVLIIFFLIGKKFSCKKLYPLIPVLIAADLVLGKYSLLLLHREIPYILVRNFLFTGMPFFLLGCFIRDGGLKKLGNTKLLAVLSVVFAAATLTERFILVTIGKNAVRDQYISTTLLAVTMFMLFERLNIEKMQKLCDIGKKYSTMIYIIHPAFIKVFAIATSAVLSGTAADIYGWCAPVVIFGASAVFAVVYEKIPFKKNKK